jgi:hypothetical protein
MSNITVGANAQPLPTDRRAVLRSLATAGAAAAIPVAAAAAAADAAAPLTAADSRVVQLWRRRQGVQRICDQRSAAWDAAYAQLPTWARGGSQYARRDGSPAGEAGSGWPMVADPSRRPLEPGGLINVRPSPDDLYGEWRKAGLTSDVALQEFARALGELAERRRQSSILNDGLDLPNLTERMEAAFNVRYAVERDIQNLMDVSDLAAAATLIVQLELEDDDGEDVPGLHRAALRALRPRLPAALAEDADRALRQEPKQTA